jgi:uncharacterized membrane protein
MSNAELLIWMHLLGLAAYFGAQFALIYMLLPAAEKAADEAHRRAALIEGFKFYNPFSIAALGIVVMTGAIRLTDFKSTMIDFFGRVGSVLSVKLLLVFLLVFIQTYVTFGLTFRIGRQEEIAAHGDGQPFTIEKVNSMLKRVRAMTWATIILTAVIILVSIRMTRMLGFMTGL